MSVNEIHLFLFMIYRLAYDRRQKRKNCLICVAYSIWELFIFVLAGLINQDSSKTFWIVFPYLFLFLPIAFQLLGAINLILSEDVMLKKTYDNSLGRIKISARLLILLSFINIILDIIFIFLYHSLIALLSEILYLICIALIAISAIAFGFIFDKLFACLIKED